MATPTYIPLATITLDSNAAAVNLSAISQDYRDLVLVVNGTTTGSALRAYLNGRASSGDYFFVATQGDGNSTGNFFGSTSSIFMGLTGAGSHTQLAQVQIMDYSATDKHKTALIRVDSTTVSARMDATRFAYTEAVTSIFIQDPAGNISAGTTITLYGIAGVA